MTILIIGASGFIGHSLYKLLREKNVIGIDIKPRQDNIKELDMSSKIGLNLIFKENTPELVYLPAFIPGVDKCELNQEVNEKNLTGISNVVELCKEYNCKLIFYSSDYVFDGKNGPYLETDTPNPINEYGKTKLLCEKMVQELKNFLIIRTTVVYGYEIDSLNFLMTFTKDLIDGKIRKVPDDQIGSPTYVEDLSKISIELVNKNKNGIYNVAGPDLCSRYEFALKIAHIFGLNEELIKPVSTDEFNAPAERPLRAGLKIDKIRAELEIEPSGIEETLKKLKDCFIK